MIKDFDINNYNKSAFGLQKVQNKKQKIKEKTKEKTKEKITRLSRNQEAKRFFEIYMKILCSGSIIHSKDRPIV